MLLNSWVIARSPTSGSSCNTLPVMRSYPGDLVGRSLFIAVRTSVSLNVRTEECGRPEEAIGISYDTAFEVAPSTGIILYHSLKRAYIAAEPLRGHLSSGCVGV